MFGNGLFGGQVTSSRLSWKVPGLIECSGEQERPLFGDGEVPNGIFGDRDFDRRFQYYFRKE